MSNKELWVINFYIFCTTLKPHGCYKSGIAKLRRSMKLFQLRSKRTGRFSSAPFAQYRPGMKTMLRTLIIAVLISSVSVRTFGEISVLRRNFTKACAFLLASTAVGITGYTFHAGHLDMPGISSRLTWANDRRALAVFLARALGYSDSEDLEYAITVTEAEEFSSKGFIDFETERVYFQLKQHLNSRVDYTFTSSPQ